LYGADSYQEKKQDVTKIQAVPKITHLNYYN